MVDAGANLHRCDRAARAIAAYDGPDLEPGQRPTRARDPENGEEGISELLCDLRHLADELGLEWAGLLVRAERYYAEEPGRHLVEVTTEGFQVLDTDTESLRADVWASRREAEAACAELNESRPASPGALAVLSLPLQLGLCLFGRRGFFSVTDGRASFALGLAGFRKAP